MNIVVYPRRGGVAATAYEGSTQAASAQIAAADFSALPALADQIIAMLGVEKAENIICPGGALAPLRAGVYEIGKELLSDAQSGVYGKHIFNDGMLLTACLAEKLPARPLMVYALSTDELSPVNRISSLKSVPKKSTNFAAFHRAAIAEWAQNNGMLPEQARVIVAKLCADVSVGAYANGVCIECNDVLGEEGPMGLTHSGDLPVGQLSGKFHADNKDLTSWKYKLANESGVKGYAGTDDPAELDRLAQSGDKTAVMAGEIMAYQTAKWVGICALALENKVDAILLCGAGSRCKAIAEPLTNRIQAIAPVQFVDPDVIGFLNKAACLAGSFSCPLLHY